MVGVSTKQDFVFFGISNASKVCKTYLNMIFRKEKKLTTIFYCIDRVCVGLSRDLAQDLSLMRWNFMRISLKFIFPQTAKVCFHDDFVTISIILNLF